RLAASTHAASMALSAQDQAFLSRVHSLRPSCTNRGFCRLGRPPGSLSTADLTHWPRALAAGAELVTGARVRELSLHADGRVSGAVYLDVAGAEHRLRARVAVVCRNGSGPPRFLL